MLRERAVSGLTYDARTDRARVTVGDGAGLGRRRAAGALLLDKGGHLVGLDVEPDEARRVVVMAGPHEAVARTAPVTLDLEERDGALVAATFGDARAAARAHEPNPYLARVTGAH